MTVNITRQMIENYDASHLIDGLPFSSNSADKWSVHLGAASARVNGMIGAKTWRGATAEAASVNAQRLSDAGDEAAEIVAAKDEHSFVSAGDLDAAKSIVTNLISTAEEAGHTVSSSLKVTPPTVPDTNLQKAYNDQAKVLEQGIQQAAQALWSLDQATASIIDGHSDSLQMVDDKVTPDWPTLNKPGHQAVPGFPFPMPPTDPPPREYPNTWPGGPGPWPQHDPDWPAPDTPWPPDDPSYQYTHHGGNFNEGIIIDRSHASVDDPGWRSGSDPAAPPPMGGGGRFIVGPTDFKTDKTPPAWPPPGGAPSSVANPNKETLPVPVIAPQQTDDPALKNCTPRDYATDIGKILEGGTLVTGGTAATVGGIAGLPETAGVSGAEIVGGLTGIAKGSGIVSDGITDLENCK